MRPHSRHQVPNDQHVDKRDDQLCHREMPCQFEDLERDENAGCNDGEVFRPTLAQHESNTFSREQPSVQERTYTQLPQLLRRHAKELNQNSVNESVVRIHAEHLDPMHDGAGEVFVQKPDCTDSHADQ